MRPSPRVSFSLPRLDKVYVEPSHSHEDAKDKTIEDPDWISQSDDDLLWSYVISFWIVAAFTPAATFVATQLGDSAASAFYVAITIAFMICGANSDLLGRWWFLVLGNVILFVGLIVSGTATSNTALYAGMGLIGFGHAIQFEEAWRWLFYAPAIAAAFLFAALFGFFLPACSPTWSTVPPGPTTAHYVGAILFISFAALILVGIVATTTIPASDPRMIATLVVGFVLLIQPLTPPHLFKAGKDREITAPFMAAFVVTEFSYAINIIYPTMVNVFFTRAETPFRSQVLLTLPSNLGLMTGALLMTLLDNKIGHWRWTFIRSVTIMVVFGALLALGTPERKGLVIALVFIGQAGFGWAQYVSIAYVQFGTEQVELGTAGGLGILTDVHQSAELRLVPAAAITAGPPSISVDALLSALSGASQIASVPGSYVVGLRTTALSSLSSGILGIMACCFCLDIGPMINNKIEVFLENDVNADKNRFD
ncbi:MFS general substrate transporter [Xylariaceae sp. FL0255]|nr:MFS general substrate transporter [Xylariaceae sp. FL0255]